MELNSAHRRFLFSPPQDYWEGVAGCRKFQKSEVKNLLFTHITKLPVYSDLLYIYTFARQKDTHPVVDSLLCCKAEAQHVLAVGLVEICPQIIKIKIDPALVCDFSKLA